MAGAKSYEEKNGKNRPPSALAGFKARMAGGSQGEGKADYRTATPAWLAAAIIAVAEQGGAIQFGYSRDGGVYTIAILMNGEVDKNYVKQSEGIDQFCERVYTAFTPEHSG